MKVHVAAAPGKICLGEFPFFWIDLRLQLICTERGDLDLTSMELKQGYDTFHTIKHPLINR